MILWKKITSLRSNFLADSAQLSKMGDLARARFEGHIWRKTLDRIIYEVNKAGYISDKHALHFDLQMIINDGVGDSYEDERNLIEYRREVEIFEAVPLSDDLIASISLATGVGGGEIIDVLKALERELSMKC